VRRWITVWVLLTLPATAWLDTLHFHRDAHSEHVRTAHAHGLALHTHLKSEPEHERSKKELNAAHDAAASAVFLSWIPSSPHPVGVTLFHPVEIARVSQPEQRFHLVVAPMPCAHDPPPAAAQNPRAPPA
jgi:hypothetical protein